MRVKDLGLNSCVTTTKLLFSVMNKEKKLKRKKDSNVPQQPKNWNVKNFEKIILYDDFRSILFQIDGRIKIKREINEEWNPTL